MYLGRGDQREIFSQLLIASQNAWRWCMHRRAGQAAERASGAGQAAGKQKRSLSCCIAVHRATARGAGGCLRACARPQGVCRSLRQQQQRRRRRERHSRAARAMLREGAVCALLEGAGGHNLSHEDDLFGLRQVKVREEGEDVLYTSKGGTARKVSEGRGVPTSRRTRKCQSGAPSAVKEAAAAAAVSGTRRSRRGGGRRTAKRRPRRRKGGGNAPAAAKGRHESAAIGKFGLRRCSPDARAT